MLVTEALTFVDRMYNSVAKRNFIVINALEIYFLINVCLGLIATSQKIAGVRDVIILPLNI